MNTKPKPGDVPVVEQQSEYSPPWRKYKRAIAADIRRLGRDAARHVWKSRGMSGPAFGQLAKGVPDPGPATALTATTLTGAQDGGHDSNPGQHELSYLRGKVDAYETVIKAWSERI